MKSLQNDIRSDTVITNEPAERRHEAGEGAENGAARKSVYMQKNYRSSVRSYDVYFWFEAITRPELLEPMKRRFRF